MSLALDDGLRRALDERIALARKLHQQSRASGHRLLAESWARKLHEAEHEAQVLRESMRRTDEIARQFSESEVAEKPEPRKAAGSG